MSGQTQPAHGGRVSSTLTRSALAPFVALVALAAPSAVAVSAGDAAPAFSLNGPQGVVSLAANRAKGEWTYLDFWASWCGPCKQSFPWMNDLHARYAGKGLRIVAVSVDTRAADAEKFLAANRASFAVAFDTTGDTPRRYAVQAMPSSVLIDPAGRVVLVHKGFKPEDRAALEDAIKLALPKVPQ